MKVKPFIDDDFLLDNDFARTLYHDYAAAAPIYDYHCHLPPDQIATDHRFSNLTDAWLRGDHYKWRALRANGVAERYITGDGSDAEKFLHWAETVPYTVRNPLYHWTHLELRRYFGVTDLLTPSTANAIYNDCNAKLAEADYSVRNLLRKMNVKLVCTTDDPLDDLRWHEQIRRDGFEVRIYPAYRPDKTLAVENPVALNKWLDRLSELTGLEVRDFNTFLEAMQKRHDYFHERGCRLSDYGLDRAYADPYTATEINTIFEKMRSGQQVSPPEQLKYKSAVLYELARMDAKAGWVLQMHLGPLRNTNTRLLNALGPDTGFDSMGDFPQGQALARFLDRLDQQNELPKTILYNNNPRDNALFATMIGNFQDGSVPGKMQYGSAWWYLDQKDGIEEHLQILSNMGLLSRLVGMLTDSRSFLSFPRHEYFRRILCNLIGRDVEGGLLPHDREWLGKIVGDICFENARSYFDMNCTG